MNEISINRNNGVNQAGFETGAPAVQPKGVSMENKPLLSITNLSVNEESSIGSDIPEAALSRNDKLGELINSSFNYPPPPMPKFG